MLKEQWSKEIETNPLRITGGRPRIVALSTYPIHPPVHGGQFRAHDLYSELAKSFDVTVLSIMEFGNPFRDFYIGTGLRQVEFPVSESHARQQRNEQAETGLYLFDVVAIDAARLSPDFAEKFVELTAGLNVVLFEQPYLFNLAEKVEPRVLLVYDAQNVESSLKRRYLGDHKHLLNRVTEIERRACQSSHLILVTCEEDMKELISLYALPREKLIIVPNSVDTKINRFIPEIERKNAKRNLGFLDKPTVLYMGSWHPPHLVGVKYIMDELAPRFPLCTFLILGTICDYVRQFGSKIPKNILLFGQMEVPKKQEFYAISDVAVNPVTFGGGTSTKTLIHMATGVPVITTPFGVRGLGAQDGVHVLIRKIPDFPNTLAELLSNHELREHLRVNARRLIEERFDSGSVGAMVRNRLLGAIEQPE